MKCIVIVNPNTKRFLEFTRNALLDSWCSQYGGIALTDPDEVKVELDKL